MKLVLGVIRDFEAAGSLTMELMDRGCLAGQIIFLADHAPAPDTPTLQSPSLYRVHQNDALSVWAIREPQYYNGGIRDHRRLESECMARIKRFDRYRSDNPRLSANKFLLRHQPLALLHLYNRTMEAVAQVKCLVNYSQDLVRIIDVPNW